MTFTVRGVRNNERVYPGYIIYDFIFYIIIFIIINIRETKSEQWRNPPQKVRKGYGYKTSYKTIWYSTI